MSKKRNELRSQIVHCLKKYPPTRNCDIKLTNSIWYEFYGGYLFRREIDGKEELCVPLKRLYDLPREDDIKRIRAKIQNEEHLFLPTEWEVARQRRFKEEEWRNYLGYAPEFNGMYDN